MKLERLSPEAVENLVASRASALILVIAAAEAQLEADQKAIDQYLATLPQGMDLRTRKELEDLRGMR